MKAEAKEEVGQNVDSSKQARNVQKLWSAARWKVLVSAACVALVSGMLGENVCGQQPGTQSNGEKNMNAKLTIPCNHPSFGLSPYAWKPMGSGDTARVEAIFPGAYFKTIVKGTTSAGLVIDGTANTGCPPGLMPIIEYSVDDGSFTVVPLTQAGSMYTCPLAANLDPAKEHRIEVYLRAADWGPQRWAASILHLRVAGVSVDAGGSLVPFPMRSKRAIGFGDSITEGIAAEGRYDKGTHLGNNNARGAWFPIVCAALDCEYGQFGSGGQGMVNTRLAVPPLPQTWDHYDATTSRLTNGLLLPEPDYVFCNMGTNDVLGDGTTEDDYTTAYPQWLAAVRAACPHASIFCVVPPSGRQRAGVRAAVATRNAAGDAKVHLIDTTSVTIPLMPNNGVPPGGTQGSYDTGHPSQWGHAIFGACVAVQVQKVLATTTGAER